MKPPKQFGEEIYKSLWLSKLFGDVQKCMHEPSVLGKSLLSAMTIFRKGISKVLMGGGRKLEV